MSRAAADKVSIQLEDFDVGAEQAALRGRCGGAVGALASFVGLVRDARLESSGDAREAVAELFLEHYPGVTERSIEEMILTARARWPLLGVTIVHRVGSLAPTEQIVLVLVASGHRPDAFAACECLMDYLKTDALLWKRELGSGAAPRWLEPSDSDRQRRSRW